LAMLVRVNVAMKDIDQVKTVLRTAAQHNGANVGVYAEVVTGGAVRRGDPVSVT